MRRPASTDPCHPDRHRHQDSHAVAPWMEQAPERPDEQPKHNQANDMKDHDQRLPALEVKETTASRLHGAVAAARRTGSRYLDATRAQRSLTLDPRQDAPPADRSLELHRKTIHRNTGVEEVRLASGAKDELAGLPARTKRRSPARPFDTQPVPTKRGRRPQRQPPAKRRDASSARSANPGPAPPTLPPSRRPRHLTARSWPTLASASSRRPARAAVRGRVLCGRRSGSDVSR